VVLHEAAWREDFQQELLTLIEGNVHLTLVGGEEADTALNAARHAGADGDADRAASREAGAATVPADPVLAEALAGSSLAGARGRLDGALVETPAVAPVAPAPLTAQPGEAAAPPLSSAPGPNLQVAGSQDSQGADVSDLRNPALNGGPLGRQGSVRARASAPLNGTRSAGRLPSRIGSAEQSNTSIRYGDELILKLFRRLEPGENPDVEVGRFLTEVADFPYIAPFFGEISLAEASGEMTTLAMLQGFVNQATDGWEWFLGQIADMLSRTGGVPQEDGQSSASLVGDPSPLPASLQPFSGSLEAAALLGRRTAELHLALATATDNPAFSLEPLRAENLASEAERIEAQLKSAFDALRAQISRLDESTSDAAALLLSRRPELLGRARAIASLPQGGMRIRIHGDLHLGQTLRTRGAANGVRDRQTNGAGDFVFLDFEGEPARSLAERRQKHSPLKDVAGMLRSFSYAAHFALNRFVESAANDGGTIAKDALRNWAFAWQNVASARFLQAYRGAIAANPDLLPAPQSAQAVLDAYLLEKALYELVYELNNRPAWLGIPISGILSL
jgi:maltose alpha-D-glucosyltransferase / alpha-amylase